MDLSTSLIWNVRGLNKKARKDSVRELMSRINPDRVCLQETKVQSLSQRLLLSMLGADLDQHVALPSTGTHGGVLIVWRSLSCQAITTQIDSSTSVLF